MKMNKRQYYLDLYFESSKQLYSYQNDRSVIYTWKQITAFISECLHGSELTERNHTKNQLSYLTVPTRIQVAAESDLPHTNLGIM